VAVERARNTSRVLRDNEHAGVASIWWRDGEATAPVPIPPARATTAQGLDGSEGSFEREAYQKGFAEGIAIGKEQASVEVQPVLDRLALGLGEISSLRSRIRRDSEQDLLKLAIAIARRVLHREVTMDPESIGGLIKVALEKLNARDQCRVRVHPSHAAFLKTSFDTLGNSQKVEVIADNSLRCGDAIFEAAHGTLDASVESQLSEIERGFADRLRR
jgi:flagellar assembly protein FliH